MNNFLKYCGLFLLTCCGVFGIPYFWGALMKPELEREPIYYSPEYIEATDELRDISFGEEDIYKLQHDVDYREGESGSWYPRQRSPSHMARPKDSDGRRSEVTRISACQNVKKLKPLENSESMPEYRSLLSVAN